MARSKKSSQCLCKTRYLQNDKESKKKSFESFHKLRWSYRGPIKKDQIIAKLKLVYDDELIEEYDLHSKEEIKKVNIFVRLIRSLNYLIWVMYKKPIIVFEGVESSR